MAKRYQDKYYTPQNVVKKLIEIVSEEIMPINEFSRIIEPSGGDGAFIKQLPKKNLISFDIAPEHDLIIKGDYLEQNIEYLKNSLVIGNPPFGTGGTLARAFIKKSLEHSDYVAFILPVDNYKKSSTMVGIRLYRSYKLPKIRYSGVPLKCCFNIYVKGNEKIKKIKGVKIIEHSKNPKKNKEYLEIDFDYRFIAFGFLRFLNKYEPVKAQEVKIIFEKKVNFKPILREFFKNKIKNSISSPRITRQELIDLIYDTYEELRVN